MQRKGLETDKGLSAEVRGTKRGEGAREGGRGRGIGR